MNGCTLPHLITEPVEQLFVSGHKFSLDRIGSFVLKIDIGAVGTLHAHRHQLLFRAVRALHQLAQFSGLDGMAGRIHNVDHQVMGRVRLL